MAGSGGTVVGSPERRDYNRDEAFFLNEMDVSSNRRSPRGLHENSTTKVTKVFTVWHKEAYNPKSLGKSYPAYDDAFLNPLAVPALVDVTERISSTVPQHNQNHVIVAPTSASGNPLKITLFFGVDGELIRFGLRSFFVGMDRVLIVLPGGRASGTNWGIGITKAQVDLLLNQVGLGGQAWEIRVMAAFSAGWRGMTGVINNALGRRFGPHAGAPVKTGLGLDLSKVETVIFYDAFYDTEQHVANAVTGLDTATGGGANFVIYEVTEGGTPRRNGALEVPIQSLIAKPNNRISVISLKNDVAALALIVARAFEGAIVDGYLTLPEAPKAIQDLLIGNLPDRGTIASKSPLAPWRPVPSGKTLLSDWAQSKATEIAAFLPKAEAIRARFLADGDRYNWMGWAPPDLGQVAHNGFIAEHGWEFLAG